MPCDFTTLRNASTVLIYFTALHCTDVEMAISKVGMIANIKTKNEYFMIRSWTLTSQSILMKYQKKPHKINVLPVYQILTWRAHNPSIRRMWTVDSPMSAAQKRRLCSSTSHITQENWTTPLSKASLVDSNTYCMEKQNRILWPRQRCIAFNKW